jgi:hypothetical protein
MEDNAQVLKALIQQVNQMKTGNSQSIVIGESMSGMIARWALRQMENEGIAHQVKLMLCYDTPHQGANVPVGLTQLMKEANPTLFTQVILKFFAKGLRDYFLAFDTPAARQQLLHWGGHLTGGVGNKHPDFDAFRTQLAALGNGGYPQNCRNMAAWMQVTGNYWTGIIMGTGYCGPGFHLCYRMQISTCIPTNSARTPMYCVLRVGEFCQMQSVSADFTTAR